MNLTDRALRVVELIEDAAARVAAKSPVVVVRRSHIAAQQINAFELGRDSVQLRVGDRHFEARRRHLTVV